VLLGKITSVTSKSNLLANILQYFNGVKALYVLNCLKKKTGTELINIHIQKHNLQIRTPAQTDLVPECSQIKVPNLFHG